MTRSLAGVDPSNLPERNEQLKIVLVADGDPWERSTNSGVALGLASALDQREDVVIVGAIDSRPAGMVKLLLRATSVRLTRERWQNEYRKGPLSTLARSITRDIALRKIRRSSSVDLVIHIRNTYRPTRVPFANFLDNTAALSQEGWPAWRLGTLSFRMRRRAEKRQFDRAVAVFTAAEHVAKDVVDRYGQSRSKVRAVGGGTNFTAQLNRPAKEGNKFSILFVGRDFERKGGAVLVRAFAQLHKEQPECVLTIVGPTRLPPAILDQPGIDFRGPISDRETLSNLYARSDVFCLPALYEPYGLVIQEALAHGTPCIVSDVGALYELTGYGNGGSMVQAGDETDLLAALRLYATNPVLLDEKRRGTREVLTNMTWVKVADRMVSHLGAMRGTRVDGE
jgi:glycosyltransferase involved in cell wall biosynthesis